MFLKLCTITSLCTFTFAHLFPVVVDVDVLDLFRSFLGVDPWYSESPDNILFPLPLTLAVSPAEPSFSFPLRKDISLVVCLLRFDCWILGALELFPDECCRIPEKSL